MNATLVWTPKALHDLEQAYLFLAEKDADAAIKALDALDKGALLLKQFPEAGRPSEDLEPEHRELIIPFGASGYILLYQIENALVYILSVRHQKKAGY